MAEEQTYVQVAKFGVDKIFDAKYKSSLSTLMVKTAEKALEKAGLTTSEPKDKKAKGFYLDGNLSSLEKIEKGKQVVLKGTIHMQLATWPKKEMFGFPQATSKLPVDNPAKIDGDVEWLVRDMIGSLVKDEVVGGIKNRKQ